MSAVSDGRGRFLRITGSLALLAVVTACTGTAGVASIAPITRTPSTTSSTAPSTSLPTAPESTDSPAARTRPALQLPVLPDIVSPAPVPTTRTDQLAQALGNEGTATLQEALDVYSLSVAPLPGATPFTLPAGAGFSPTTAIALINHFRGQLTPAQAALVDAAQQATVIGVFDHQGRPVGQAGTTTQAKTPAPTAPPTASTAAATRSIAPSGLRTPGRALAGPVAPPAAPTTPIAPPPSGYQYLLAVLQIAISDWHTKHPELIDRVSAESLAVATTDTPVAGTTDQLPDMTAQRSPTTANGCLITVYPNLLRRNRTDLQAEFEFAHELFHCIQFTWADITMLPDWLVEGSAQWAAMDLYRNTDIPNWGARLQWFTNPGTPLGQEGPAQGYNAWPLFEAFQEQFGTSAYPSIQAMVTSGGTTADLLAAGDMDGPIFAQLWSSTSIRSSTFPEAVFHLDWPSSTPEFPAQSHDLLVPEDPRGIGSFSITVKGAFRHLNYSVPFTDNVGVVGVSADGGALLTRDENGPATVADGHQRFFCVQAGGCTCPAGTSPTVNLTDVTGPMLLSFPAQTADTTASLDDLSWDPSRYCADDPPAGSTDPTGPIGTSNGDPHLATFDGLLYDFMTLGEFVAAQDPTGGFTIQERHQPASFGTATAAVAVGDGSSRVTFTAQHNVFDAPITIRVDGAPTTASTVTAGGLHVVADTDRAQPTWTVTWPDGTAVQLEWDDGFFLTVAPSAARAGRIVGILGRPDGDDLDDLSMPDGSRASPAAGYQAFAQSWLVTDASSLFDYAAGQRTETFRIPPADRPTVVPPSAQAVKRCVDELGEHATAGEIHDCAYDLTALDPGAADAQALVGQYRAEVNDRQDQVQQEPPAEPYRPRIVVGGTSTAAASTGDTVPITPAPTSTDTAPPAPSAPVTTGSLTLHATFPVDPVGPDPEHPLQPPRGMMHLVQGSVLMVKVDCPVGQPNFDLLVVIGIPLTVGSKDNGNAGLCGQEWRLDTIQAASGAKPEVGEAYLLIETTGDYAVELHNVTGGDLPAPIQMTAQFTADPTPLVATGALPSAGVSRTLSPGSSMAVMLSPGSAGGTWTIDGGGSACVKLRYITDVFTRPSSPVDLTPFCSHPAQVSIPADTESFPLIIFSRSGPAVAVTVRRTK